MFTHTSANEGNKKLAYPVGTITSDEVVFAGGFEDTANLTYYLYANQDYWTMSPRLYSSYIYMYIVNSVGNITGCDASVELGIRPIINLRADTKLTGEGSETSPFEVVAS